MRLTFLGTKGEVEKTSKLHRSHSAVRLETHGKTILLDFGASWRGKLKFAGRPDYIWLSHAHPDHCFASHSTPVLTSEGYKPISKIKIGDLVRTHKDRLQPVTKIFKHYAGGIKVTRKLYNRVWRLRAKGQTRPKIAKACNLSLSSLYRILNNQFSDPDCLVELRCEWKQILRLTENHPVLVRRGNLTFWKRAGKIREGEFLVILQQGACLRCGKPMPVSSSFCSRNCSSKFFYPRNRKKLSKAISESNSKRAISQHHKDMAALQARRIQPLAVQASLKKGAWKKGLEIARHKIANYGQSRLERITKWWLQKNNIEFFAQFPVKRPNSEFSKQKYYFIDFFLPRAKILLECDGKYWHSRRKNPEREEYLAKLAKRNNWKIIHLEEEKILRYDFSLLIPFIKLPNSTFISTKVKKCVKRMNCKGLRWNLEIKEDNSYIVKGFPVHNCFGLRGERVEIPVFMTKETSKRLPKDRFPFLDRRIVKDSFKFGSIQAQEVPVKHSTVAPTSGLIIHTDEGRVGYFPDVLNIPDKSVLRGLSIYIGDGSSLTRNIVRATNGKVGHASCARQMAWCQGVG